VGCIVEKSVLYWGPIDQARVAQWQSSALLMRRLEVRLLPRAPLSSMKKGKSSVAAFAFFHSTLCIMMFEQDKKPPVWAGETATPYFPVGLPPKYHRS
jgi:hypothetical protein